MTSLFYSTLAAATLLASAADFTPSVATHGRTAVEAPAGAKGTGIDGKQLTGFNRDGKDIVPSATARVKVHKEKAAGPDSQEKNRQDMPNGN
jgi:hypothetical protein